MMDFLTDKMDMKDYLAHCTFTSDFAVYGPILNALKKLGSDLKMIDTEKLFSSFYQYLRTEYYKQLIVFFNSGQGFMVSKTLGSSVAVMIKLIYLNLLNEI